MAAPDWMGTIQDDTLLLGQITVPGSHDAGVSTVHNSSKGLPVSKTLYVCQGLDFNGQLQAGSRFFDIRFSMKGTDPTTVHETAGTGGWGESADSIFNALNLFLEAHPREIVMLRISHTNSETGVAVFRCQQRHLHASRCYSPAGATNVACGRLGAYRGKAIVAYAKDAIDKPSAAAGQTRFGKASGSDRSGLITCGEYASSDSMAKVMYKQMKRTNEHRRNGGQTCCDHPMGDHLFMMYWQLTGGDVQTNTLRGGGPPAGEITAFEADKGTHYNLNYLLNLLAGKTQSKQWMHGESTQAVPAVDAQRYLWAPNIISMDFVSDAACDAVIEFNRKNLAAAGKA